MLNKENCTMGKGQSKESQYILEVERTESGDRMDKRVQTGQ
jgi:hypothetical protein